MRENIGEKGEKMGIKKGSQKFNPKTLQRWRYRSPNLYIDPKMCLFTDDLPYILFSSLVSFYIPVF